MDEEEKTDAALIFKQVTNMGVLKLSIVCLLIILGIIGYSVITKSESPVVVVDGNDTQNQCVTQDEFNSAIASINKRFSNLIIQEKTHEKTT
jgi:hypothetical protein